MGYVSQKFLRGLLRQPNVPKPLNDYFLVKLSIAYPLKKWLGSYEGDIIQRAKALGIYEVSYTPKTTFKSIIAEGYEGEAIKAMYDERLEREIKDF